MACGDALGTTLEFTTRGRQAPVTDIVGGGPFGLRAGEWTDDTSMALCLATSLVERRAFDADDQMRNYNRWAETGWWSSNGVVFDIGATVSAALRRYRRTGDPMAGSTDPQTAGNGSLMRLAPIPMAYAHDLDACERYAALSSRTTHAAPEAVDACRLFARIVARALRGADKEEALGADASTFRGAPTVEALAQGSYRALGEADVAGSGYVIRSLEAALWSVWTTPDAPSAILRAANLCDDADTTAAIAGQLAGALYGEHGLPAHWRKRLVRHDDIAALAEALATLAAPSPEQ